jgi:hypothetical protein
MTTLPGGWNDLPAPAARPAAEAPAPHAEPAAPISVQRCLPVTAAQSPASGRRCGAQTQLGMPALPPAPHEAPRAPESCPAALPSVAPASPARPRRGPPPLPARFASPKVIVAATPLLPDTVPARRLQLADVTCELDPADLLKIPARRRAAPAPAGPSLALRPAPATRGVRGLVAGLLVRMLSLLEPSVQLQRVPRERVSRTGRRG